jgi:hypothetical protein
VKGGHQDKKEQMEQLLELEDTGAIDLLFSDETGFNPTTSTPCGSADFIS